MMDLKEQIQELIACGEKIGKEEYHPIGQGTPISYVSGPQFDQWMGEIAIFTDRHLKCHTLYKSIYTLALDYRKKSSPHKQMMGYLKTLLVDDEFFESIDKKGDENSMSNRKSIEQLLEEDIARCEQFLANPSDNKIGQQLYIEITGRYDTVIEGFGNGLYEYNANLHFYEPDISEGSLVHNLTVLTERMKTHLAINYPVQNNNPKTEQESQEKIIFLSHKSDDKKYGNALRDFIIGLGVKDEQLIYTSHPLNKIPMDENIYAYLRRHINSNMFMIILWSDKYLESPACLNEMGAAWVTQADYTNIYVPDFSFGNPKYHECAVDTRKMGAVLNGDAHCKTSMIEFKNKIVNLFDLTVSEEKTNYLLDQFIESIKA